MHRITGKPPDITPVVYRLEWLRAHAPQTLERAAYVLDVHGFLTLRLVGRAVASWTSADPFGLFDIHTKRWSPEILEQLALSETVFAPAFAPGTTAGTITPQAARTVGLVAGTPVFCAGGDGQCAGLGTNAVKAGRVYLNLGTAIITGIWSDTAEISLRWRTMTSPTGEGYFLEGVLRAGTLLLDWFVQTFAQAPNVSKEHTIQTLEKDAALIPVGSLGVSVCPYLVGCMDPHWDPAAKASIHGLGLSHTQSHVYRALLEAQTLEIARCIAAMGDAGLSPREIYAVGGGARSVLWRSMLADATGLPLVLGRSPEASSLGAAITAAVGLGWAPTFGQAADAMCRAGAITPPEASARPLWDALSRRQAATYTPNRPPTPN